MNLGFFMSVSSCTPPCMVKYFETGPCLALFPVLIFFFQLFQCVCDEGYRGDGISCDEIDECVENPTLCENGHCINFPGGYRCQCDMGFMNPDDKNQQLCVGMYSYFLIIIENGENNSISTILNLFWLDINECQIFNNLCVFGKCENLQGMFKCECNPGYQVDSSGGMFLEIFFVGFQWS